MNRISNLQTIYQYGGDLYEKNKILLKPSSNCKVVRVKSNRVCADCGALIDKGSSCYTFNPRGRGGDGGYVFHVCLNLMLRKLNE